MGRKSTVDGKKLGNGNNDCEGGLQVEELLKQKYINGDDWS
jgi:hypothetical protein